MENTVKPVILSCAGTSLSDEERDLFRAFTPFGFIVFKRNIENRQQLKSLTAALRDAAGWDCPILIDQEGGKVRRMRPPEWPDYPSMKEIGDLDDKDRLIETVRGISADLTEVGIDVDCAPVLDVLFPDTHDAIGDRAFSHDPAVVGALGSLACQIFIENGVTPVVKHMPGQGRAAKDSHYDLPVVAASLDDLRAIDFPPFRHVLSQDFAAAVWGMVSHIVYPAVDPVHPASVSAAMTRLIRGELGFDGLLVSDDLCMNALCTYGSPADRVIKTLEAGLDIALYCAGHLNEMREIASACPPMRTESLRRYDASRIRGRSPA